MNPYTKRQIQSLSGLWLAILSVALVIAWRERVVAHKPAHLMKMADELGWIGHFHSGLYPNHSNTGLLFSQTTETGVGVYFCSATGGKKKLICEQAEKGWSWQKYGMLGWSPDDHFFACAFPPNDPKQPDEEIIIGNGLSGERVVTLAADRKLSELAWLSPGLFAYSFWNGSNHGVAVIEQKPDGNWVLTKVFKQIGDKDMTGLAAVSAHSVAWRQGPSLWVMDLADTTPKKIWESHTNKLQAFTYSDKDGTYDLTCSDETHWYQVRFRPPTPGNPQGTVLDNLTPAGNETTYANLRNDGGFNTFHINTGVQSPPIDLPWPGLVMSYTMNGDSLYVTGDLTNQPPGIFRYNLVSKETTCFVSALDHPLKHAQIVGAVTRTFTNSAGKLGHYFVWQPVKLEAGKKHPLIIGQTTYNWWLPYPQVAANGGCYFVFVNRPTWWDGLENWGNDVMQVYEMMAKNPHVDTNQVYLYGMSAETRPLSRLLAEVPTLWQGAILFNPTATPDPPVVHISKILVLDGTADGNANKRWPDYQDRAVQAGLTVKLALVDGAQHVSNSTANEHAKTEQIARFLFGD